MARNYIGKWGKQKRGMRPHNCEMVICAIVTGGKHPLPVARLYLIKRYNLFSFLAWPESELFPVSRPHSYWEHLGATAQHADNKLCLHPYARTLEQKAIYMYIHHKIHISITLRLKFEQFCSVSFRKYRMVCRKRLILDWIRDWNFMEMVLSNCNINYRCFIRWSWLFYSDLIRCTIIYVGVIISVVSVLLLINWSPSVLMRNTANINLEALINWTNKLLKTVYA